MSTSNDYDVFSPFFSSEQIQECINSTECFDDVQQEFFAFISNANDPCSDDAMSVMPCSDDAMTTIPVEEVNMQTEDESIEAFINAIPNDLWDYIEDGVRSEESMLTEQEEFQQEEQEFQHQEHQEEDEEFQHQEEQEEEEEEEEHGQESEITDASTKKKCRKIKEKKCPYCEQVFYDYKRHFVPHCKEHLRSFEQKSRESAEFATSIKKHLFLLRLAITEKYVCKFCPKRFSHWRQLKNHERIHLDEKPFECKKCNTFFRTESCLHSHSKVCFPFECEKCRKKLMYKSSMDKHVKFCFAYICTKCDKVVKNDRCEHRCKKV